MQKIISKNPNRTEENAHLFDYYAGKFIVSYGRWTHEFPWEGKVSDRILARRRAFSWYNAFKPFYPGIEIIEI